MIPTLFRLKVILHLHEQLNDQQFRLNICIHRNPPLAIQDYSICTCPAFFQRNLARVRLLSSLQGCQRGARANVIKPGEQTNEAGEQAKKARKKANRRKQIFFIFMHNNKKQNKGGEKAGNEAGKMSLKHSGSKSQRSAPHESNHKPIKHSAIPAQAKSVNQLLHLPKEASSNELLDNKHCFDIDTHVEVSSALGKSTAVLAT